MYIETGKNYFIKPVSSYFIDCLFFFNDNSYNQKKKKNNLTNLKKLKKNLTCAYSRKFFFENIIK